MFDMKRNSGTAGYTLAIKYDLSRDEYGLTGYILNKVGEKTVADMDGGTLYFDSLEEAVDNIIRHGIEEEEEVPKKKTARKKR